MELILDYISFLLKVVTVAVAIIAILTAVIGAGVKRSAKPPEGHIEITHLNDRIRDMRHVVEYAGMSHRGYHKAVKAARKAAKAERKRREREDKSTAKALADGEPRKRVFVLRFDGDLQGNQVDALRREVTAVLSSATSSDEVVVTVASAGGMVSSYGLAASQLVRIRSQGIALTTAIDEVAASGGYLMAVVADKILAAPFAYVGSIGVAAEIPNVHRLLKKHDIDYEVLTAGKYKRTMTVFGENTTEHREKLVQEMEDIHGQFRDFVAEYRSDVNLDEVATGETWMGRRAVDLSLVDALMTSDEYLAKACDDSDVFEVKWVRPKTPMERFVAQASMGLRHVVERFMGGIR